MTRFLTATAMAIVATAAVAAQPAAPIVTPAPAAPPSTGHVMERSQVQAMVREHFGRMDADKDGAITTVEISALRGAKGGHHMAHGGGHDMDHDGAPRE